VFALIEGLGLRQIGARILHELAFGVLAAEAVGLALDRRMDGAIRLHVDWRGPRNTYCRIGRSVGCGGKSKHEHARECGRGVNSRHGSSPGRVGTAHTHRPLSRKRALSYSVPAADRLTAPALGD
jgi:hypothetical protein